MSTIALIGPDGTGKTTIAKALVRSGVAPMKYLYMGMSIESSNVALPSSRLIHRLKLAAHNGRPVLRGESSPIASTSTGWSTDRTSEANLAPWVGSLTA